MFSDSIYVSVIQMDSGLDRTVNLAKTESFVREAAQAGAQFIALPELFNFRGTGYTGESLDGPSISLLVTLATQLSVWILAGSFCEIQPQNQNRFFNSSVLIGPHGIIAVYRKLHLFDALVEGKKIQESNTFLAGDRPVLTSLMDTIPLGMSICYDLRFSSLFSWYARQGAQMICIPASFTYETGTAHWEILVRARAIETQCFVIAPNQVGPGSNGVETFGNSLIVDPWGRVLVQGDTRQEGPLYATLDFSELNRVRTKIPVGQHYRDLG